MRSLLGIVEHLGLQTRDYLRVVYTAQASEEREIDVVEVGWAVVLVIGDVVLQIKLRYSQPNALNNQRTEVYDPTVFGNAVSISQRWYSMRTKLG